MNAWMEVVQWPLNNGRKLLQAIPSHLRLGVAVLIGILVTPSVYGDTVDYKYDGTGRVIEAVNSTSGNTTIYAYDSVGNITKITNVTAPSVAVAGFVPDRAVIGASVTIYGTGFAATPAGNSVKFNGVTASVTSATATELIAVVPSGATTGKISVTNGLTGESATNFIVAAYSPIPTVTGFSPASGPPGTAVTVTGTGFAPLETLNRVDFNQTAATIGYVVASSGSGTIGTTVPEAATSGKIAVTTPSGRAQSLNDFYVLPIGMTSAQLVSSGRVTVGGPLATLTFSTTNKVGLRVFEGTAGQYLILQLTNNSIPSATLSVLAPDGSPLVSASVSPSTPAVQLPKLELTGTYTVLVSPGNQTGSVKIAVLGPITGNLTVGGAATPYVISPAGRRALITFPGTANSQVTINATGITIPSSALSILQPNGDVVIGSTYGTGTASLSPKLPVAGTYTILVNPVGSVTGNITLAVANTGAETLPLSSAVNLTVGTSVVSARFNGAEGEYSQLVLSQSGSGSSVSVIVKAPTGATLASGALSGGSIVLNLGYLPSSGSYLVTLQRPTGSSGTVTVKRTSPVAVTANVNGGLVTGSTTTSGQGMLVSFFGTAGKAVAAVVTESSSKIIGASVYIMTPDRSVLASGTLSTTEDQDCGGFFCTGTGEYSGSVTLTTGPLPATGTYTLAIKQSTAGTGTLKFNLTTPSGDLDPNGFSFVDVIDVPVGTIQTSNEVTIGGITSSVPVKVIGGQYSKNGGAFTAAAGTAVSGDRFKVKHTSSAEIASTEITTLQVGSQADSFSSTTLATPSVPPGSTLPAVLSVILGN